MFGTTTEDVTLYELQLLGIIESASGVRTSNIRPSDFTEQNIVMGEPRPGPYRYTYTPYCREIIDRLAANDPAKWVAVMKGLQIGISAGVIIPGLCYIIKESPANTYFTVGAPDLIEKAVDKLDLAIDKAGLRSYIKPQANRNRQNKSGDTNTKKDFPLGFINITTPNNHKEWRDVSLKYGFIDDFESAKSKSKESGSTRKLVEGRFAAYKDKHKIFYISTPELKINSNIEPAYLLGDQRKYMVPCPHCAAFIELRWNTTEGIGTVWKEALPEGAGIQWDLDDDNNVIDASVRYVCQECMQPFTDANKLEMLNNGYWQPTAKPKQAGFFSYHISSLYAPPGMYDWTHYVHNYMEACPIGAPREESEYMTFVTTCLGITYTPSSEMPKAASIQRNCRDYRPAKVVHENPRTGEQTWGTIPEQQSIRDGNGPIILLTLAADLNGIQEKDAPVDRHDVRLDYEILAHSAEGATYSIMHGSIGTFQRGIGKDETDRKRFTYEDNKSNSVWPEFEKVLSRVFQTDTESKDSPTGFRRMGIRLAGLDVGHFSTHAYAFLDKTTLPIIGLKGDKEQKYIPEGIDAVVFKPGLERKQDYILKVGMIKDKLSNYMALTWDRNKDSQPSDFMNFPEPNEGLYTLKDYFEHFESEKKDPVLNRDGSTSYRWVKKHSAVANHMWDCRVYNLAIRDIIVQRYADTQEPKIKGMKWRDYVKHVLG